MSREGGFIISGLPYRAIASSTASTQNLASLDLQVIGAIIERGTYWKDARSKLNFVPVSGQFDY
jgi:hypothetical protein